MYCLWCAEELAQGFSWSNFLSLVKSQTICETCKKNLLYISGNRCKKCSRETKQEVCSECIWWGNQKNGNSLSRNYSIYYYNTFIQDIITKWKYRGDYILGNIFESDLLSCFNREYGKLIKEAVIAPIPLSEERLQERGFNQAVMLANLLPGTKADLLSRKHGEKQSKKSRIDRITQENPFFLKQKINKKVILVDDIYTTGTTLRHAAKILIENGCPEVYAFTLIRG